MISNTTTDVSEATEVASNATTDVSGATEVASNVTTHISKVIEVVSSSQMLSFDVSADTLKTSEPTARTQDDCSKFTAIF